MKLYTEEQVKRAIALTLDSPTHSNLVLDHLTPIELPTDEEVERRIKDLEKRLYDCSKSNADLIGKINELPSDKEIEAYLKSFPYTKHLDDGQYNDGVIVGAELAIEWMKNKIQGGNK